MKTSTSIPSEIYGIKTASGFRIFSSSELIHIEAQKANTLIYVTGSNKSVKSVECISTFRKCLPENFVTCHRSHIVNVLHIRELDKDCRTLHLSNKDTVKVSQKYLKNVLKHLVLIVKK